MGELRDMVLKDGAVLVSTEDYSVWRWEQGDRVSIAYETRDQAMMGYVLGVIWEDDDRAAG